MSKVLIIILVMISFSVSGQEDLIGVRIKIEKDSVFLRWAPVNAQVWQSGNKNGYIVERIELPQIIDSLYKPKGVVITTKPIIPYPESFLDSIDDDDIYPGVVLQSIYSQEFEPASPISNLKAYLDYNNDLQNRFGFALLASDVSVKAAKIHGLFFQDIVPDTTKRYMYRVALLDSSLSFPDGFVLYEVGRKSFEPAINLKANFEESKAILSWSKLLYERYYTGYFIERSIDGGKHFQFVNKTPIISLFNEQQGDWSFFIDSINDENSTYTYRIRGITPFGTLGPVSNTVEGQNIKKITEPAFLGNLSILPGNSVSISWERDSTQKDLVKGFNVLRTNSLSEEWKVINKFILGKHERNYVDKYPVLSSYYMVETIGLNGESVASNVRLGQLIDSIPPSPPMAIKGIVSETGLVTLNWKKPQEVDIQGYRVFRGNNKNEIVEITNSLCLYETIKDSININISPYVWYSVTTVDNNFNQSSHSEAIKLIRPDTVPPHPALITNLQVDDRTVSFDWIESPSPDAVLYKILRIGLSSLDTLELKSWNIEQIQPMNTFNDQAIKDTQQFKYVVSTIDASGNSSFSNSVKADFNKENLAPVDAIKVTVDRRKELINIIWQYKHSHIKEFKIYRTTNRANPQCIAILKEGEFNFIDREIKPNNEYGYFVRAISYNHNESPIIVIKSINY